MRRAVLRLGILHVLLYSLRLWREIQSHAVNGRAIDLHVFRHRLRTVRLNTHTILPHLRREPKLERTSLRRDSPIDLLRRPVFQYARQLHFRIRHASAFRTEHAATEERYRAFVDSHYQTISERASLTRFNLDILDRTDAESRFPQGQPVNPRRQLRDNKFSVFISGRACDLGLSAPHDDGH